jgi:hypothetical protein
MATVVNYKVGSTRAARSGPVRWLTLQLGAPEGSIRGVSLFFWERDPGAFGFVNEDTGFVVANLPVADFQGMYAILQTEKPVFVHWRTDPEEARLASIDISTSEEPVGEGTNDTSP